MRLMTIAIGLALLLAGCATSDGRFGGAYLGGSVAGTAPSHP